MERRNEYRPKRRSPSPRSRYEGKRQDTSRDRDMVQTRGETSGRDKSTISSSIPSRTHHQPTDLGQIDPNDEEALLKMMGFSGFDTTKGKHVQGNVHEAVHKKKKTQYRQLLRKKRLYEIPLTRQQLEEQERKKEETMPK